MTDHQDRAAASLALDTTADARNRAIRTALQAFAVVVLVDAIPLVVAALDSEDVDWGQVGKAVLRVVLMALLSLVMRYAAPPPAPELD